MDTSNPIYFNRDHNDFNMFKKIILEQCELDKTYIKSCINRFTDGYILLGNKSTIGKTIRSKADKYFLKAYCLFEYDEEWSEVKGLITCSHSNYPDCGLVILESVNRFISEFKVLKWTLYSLPFEKLVNYYKRLGFREIDTKYTPGGKKKVIVMVQDFQYLEDEIEDVTTCGGECDIHID